MTNPYSPLKIFHHREWISDIREGNQPSPIFVQIIPTNRCNQNCSFCAYRMDGYTSNQLFVLQDQLTADKLAEIVDDCARMGVKAIELTGGGEPTIHPYFVRLCKKILDYEIDLGLVTNGAAWTPEITDVLRRAKWIRFSFDAGTPETYKSMRASSTLAYERARKSLRAISELKMGDLLLGVGFVVTKENYKEVLLAADNAFSDGADNFRISALFQSENDDYFRHFGEVASALCQQVEEKYKGTHFRIFNLFNDRLNDLSRQNPDYSFCGFQQASTYIGADYGVYRCCNQAYNERGLLGSIANQSFRQLWESEEKKKRIREFDARGCERCMFNNKNRTILYAIDPKPLHANFV